MQSSLESEVAVLLTDLMAGQDAMLHVLDRKRELLAAVDQEGLAVLGAEEQRVLEVLQDCLRRREQLLSRSAADGLPSTSLQALADGLPPTQRGPLNRQLAAAGSRARLLQHQSLVNWVVIQRTLIHLSQLLEIIATGGRFQPTYGERTPACAGGSLVNQEA